MAKKNKWKQIELLINLESETISEVIHSLDKIIEWAKINNSKLGYFPALYRKVTKRVKQGIHDGYFDNGPFMEKLDVRFANRYFEALEAYIQNEPCTEAWKMAFNVTNLWQPIVLQHLMLGMNAHINLDLGISASDTVGDGDLNLVQADFYRINELLVAMIKEVKMDLAKVWPFLRVTNFLVGKGGNWIAKSGMIAARNFSWKSALAVHYLDGEARVDKIKFIDDTVVKVGENLLVPGYFTVLAILLIRLTEFGSVKRIIEILE